MTRRAKAKAGLSVALRFLHESEAKAKHHARMLALTKKDLALHREAVRLCTEDARNARVL
jgi:hypothetical protein